MLLLAKMGANSAVVFNVMLRKVYVILLGANRNRAVQLLSANSFVSFVPRPDARDVLAREGSECKKQSNENIKKDWNQNRGND